MSDLVGSTRLIRQLGDRHAARLFKRHDRLARDLLAEHGGLEIDKTDGFLMLFDRPLEAVRYALAYHEALDELSREIGAELAARVGVHLGEVFLRENSPEDVERGAKPLEVEGLAKPTAARLMSLAGKRQTLLTRFAFDIARRAAVGTRSLFGNLKWLSHGTYEMVGVGEPIDVFEVGVVGFAPLTAPPSQEKARSVEESDPASEAIAVGVRLIERYALVAELGHGGMGQVYRARDELLNRDVAIKTIARESLKGGFDERFLREAQVVAQMDHPAIVPIYDIGDQAGTLFLVMPLLEGTTLRDLIREGSLRLGETIDMAIQLAEALDYSHGLGVVHRDVKPENIMISRVRDGLRTRLMDFGLALDVEASRLTGSGKLVGTAAYMSPEQVGEAKVDGRSDLYSLATVLYECLAGEPPFSGTLQALVYRIAHEYPESIRARGVEVDEKLDEIVLACLAKDSAKRPATGKALAGMLRRYLGGLRQKEHTKSVAVSAVRRAQHRGQPNQLPLVGRRAELAELQARLNAALEGECQLVLVEGDAGTGKKRLLAELGKLAAARGIQVLRGRFADFQNALPFQGFCQLVQDYFRHRESRGTNAGEAVDLRDLASDLVALFPVFSEIPELRSASSSADAPAPRIAPQARAGQTDPTAIFELLARTIRRLAGDEPLVILFENLHGGDVSLDALEYMVHRLGPTPTLFVGTYRPEEVDRGHPLHRLREHLHDDPRVGRLVLGALRAGEFRQLVEAILGSSEVRQELVDELYEATAGNPFFGEELVKSLVETEGIRRDESGTWKLSQKAGIVTDALPATIRQAVERRIDRLDDEHRRVLATASVLGRNFEFEDLEALVEHAGRLDDALDALIDSGLLIEDRQSRGDRLAFSSGVICDVLYRALPRRRRRSLHRRHAERLEKRFAGRLERVHPQLVHHFAEAEVAAKTVAYALAYARRLLEAWSAEDTARICRTALEFVDELGGGEALEEGGELHLLLARAERISGHLARAFKEAERGATAFGEAGSPEKAAEAALFLAETAWRGRESEATDRWIARGTQLARDSGSTEILRQLLTLGATVANLRGEHQAAQEALKEAERLAPPEPETAEEESVPAGGTLITALPAAISTLDPSVRRNDEEAEVAANVFETLLTTSPDGALVPWLSEHWGTSVDKRTFEMKLCSDITFSDGCPLTAPDVKRSLERWARQGTENSVTSLSVLEGFQEFADGRSDDIRGIVVRSDLEVVFHLKRSLPIFPALLTNIDAAIVRPAVPSGDAAVNCGLLGTGPFRLTETAYSEKVVLERNSSYWRGPPPRLDRVEFKIFTDAAEISQQLRSGDIDLGRDLPPEDLEEILRDPRFRSGLAEATKKNVYFILFNQSGPVARHREVREALTGVVRAHELVWRALGRFAQPAVCLIPPGIFGHDPGRRPSTLMQDHAAQLLSKAAVKPPIRLRATVHPLLRNRYTHLTNALIREWEALGCEISIHSESMDLYIRSQQENQEFDLLIGRWVGDYDDPDSFTYGLFHTENGILRRYFSSAETDSLLEQARQEKDTARRQSLYRQFEDLLDRESALVPLFHDVNYRIASPRIRGLSLANTWPYVNYASVGKVEESAPDRGATLYGPSRRLSRGEIHVPIPAAVESLDPTIGMFTDYWEVGSCVFESLARVERGARTEPALAAAIDADSGGRAVRVELREDVRFHDGRRMSARDVRYSFERVLRNPRSELHQALLPIRGARALRDGAASTLSGLKIRSATEVIFELEHPLPFFSALLTTMPTAIVPEGCETFDVGWRQGCAGTGAFRIVEFDRGRKLELEGHPEYWRPGFPKCDRLVFHFGSSPEEILAGFRGGGLSLAAELRPGDVEALRREPRFAARYRESPRLATYFLALNIHEGPFIDSDLRQELARSCEPASFLRETAGRLAVPAHGLIPPGLLGHEPRSVSPRPVVADSPRSPGLKSIDLKAATNPSYDGPYAAFWARLTGCLEKAGFRVESLHCTASALNDISRERSADLIANRWFADYPDAHGFVSGLLHSESGWLGGFCGTPEIDRLIDAGQSEMQPSLRHEIYHEIEQVLRRDALVIPLFHEQTYRFCHPSVRGLRFGWTVPEIHYEELYVEG